MNQLEISETPILDGAEVGFKPAQRRGRPKKGNFQEQENFVEPVKKVKSRKERKEEKREEGKEEKLRYKRIQMDTLFHNFVVNINFLVEKQVGNQLKSDSSCDGKTFRVLKAILIDNLAEVFLMFLSLRDQDLTGVRVFFSLSKNRVFNLNLLELKKAIGIKSKENDLKIALLEWFKSNSFFNRGNTRLVGVEILLNDAAIKHLKAQNIPENYHLRTVYILSKKDIIVKK